jgi:hypothetical protein
MEKAVILGIGVNRQSASEALSGGWVGEWEGLFTVGEQQALGHSKR